MYNYSHEVIFMPTTKKRVNLTITDELYDRILRYKKKNGVTSDASACLQLISLQLDSVEQTEQLLRMVSQFTPDELKQINNIGMNQLMKALDTANPSKTE